MTTAPDIIERASARPSPVRPRARRPRRCCRADRSRMPRTSARNAASRRPVRLEPWRRFRRRRRRRRRQHLGRERRTRCARPGSPEHRDVPLHVQLDVPDWSERRGIEPPARAEILDDEHDAIDDDTADGHAPTTRLRGPDDEHAPGCERRDDHSADGTGGSERRDGQDPVELGVTIPAPMPASILIVAPFICRASSETSHATSEATSAAVPNRPAGGRVQFVGSSA